MVLTYYLLPLSRKSAIAFLHAVVRIGTPQRVNTLNRRRVCFPLLVPGGQTRLQESAWGAPIRTRGQTLWYSRYICT
jgi:hypothetical protein